MNPVALPTAGFHYGVPYEDYAAWDAINFSRLKPIRHTASKCRWEMDHPKKPTAAMILGSALHIATLEPARFDEMFYICPQCNRTTKEGKEIWAKAEKEANGKTILRQGSPDDKGAFGEIESLRGMAASIRRMKSTAPFLTGEGQNEVSMLWKDPETGLWCKGRMDRFLPAFKVWDAPVKVELKKTRNASEWHFGKDVDSFDYDAQDACYRAGVKAITGKNAVGVFIAVESEPPYDAALYSLDDPELLTGENKYRQMLNRYAECVKTGKWPGYPDKPQILKMPRYANERNYD